jgi:hypothetical protein
MSDSKSDVRKIPTTSNFYCISSFMYFLIENLIFSIIFPTIFSKRSNFPPRSLVVKESLVFFTSKISIKVGNIAPKFWILSTLEKVSTSNFVLRGGKKCALTMNYTLRTCLQVETQDGQS